MPQPPHPARPPDTHPVAASSLQKRRTELRGSPPLFTATVLRRVQPRPAFSERAWIARFGNWNTGVRTLAHVLRGLEGAGLIERRTLRPSRLRAHPAWDRGRKGFVRGLD